MDEKNKTASACSGLVWDSAEQNALIRDSLAQHNWMSLTQHMFQLLK